MIGVYVVKRILVVVVLVFGGYVEMVVGFVWFVIVEVLVVICFLIGSLLFVFY